MVFSGHMDCIFFEKQEGMLCAQHALNMLLQDSLFTPMDLSEIAMSIDSAENTVLSAENLPKTSENMDDSGFFSIQVIQKALEPFALELKSLEHPTVADIKLEPTKAKAFICNMEQHWFVIRRFGQQWFSLNSVKSGPELLSEFYFTEYISTLGAQGYSIFLVCGLLPECTADDVISKCPVVRQPTVKKDKESKESKESTFQGAGHRLGGSSNPEDEELTEEEMLQKAILQSLEEHSALSSSPTQEPGPNSNTLQPEANSDAIQARNKRDMSRFM